VNGLTLDRGVLIAFEKRDRRAVTLFREARMNGYRLTVSSLTLAEWWQDEWGNPHYRSRALRALHVQPFTDVLARAAGRALRKLGLDSCHLADAGVMATAAARGDVLVTTDPEDMKRLRPLFEVKPTLLPL
jgi:predicted nucleic acid-binding protein